MLERSLKFIHVAVQALALMLARPSGRQVAALCLRDGKVGKDVLLVSSLQSDRWIIPKGWPIAGKDFPNAALAEAWEEAGVSTGRVQNEKIGQYNYIKTNKNGTKFTCLVDVFAVQVKGLADEFPESSRRRRQWVTQSQAVTLVREPTLKKIIGAI